MLFVRPVLVKAISQECLEGILKKLAQMSTWSHNLSYCSVYNFTGSYRYTTVQRNLTAVLLVCSIQVVTFYR